VRALDEEHMGGDAVDIRRGRVSAVSRIGVHDTHALLWHCCWMGHGRCGHRQRQDEPSYKG
jgi:hypothetical protein